MQETQALGPTYGKIGHACEQMQAVQGLGCIMGKHESRCIFRPWRAFTNMVAWLQATRRMAAMQQMDVPDGLDEAAAGILDAQHGLKGWHDLLASGVLAAETFPPGGRLPHHTLPHLHTQH